MDQAAVAAQIERDAVEFGHFIRQGGWRLGLLVARCVGKGEGKVSAAQFARWAGVAAVTVSLYQQAWDRAAAEGVVPRAVELLPGEELDGLDETTLPGDWADYFERVNSTSGTDRAGYEAAAREHGVAISTAINVGRKRGAAKAAYKADPAFRKAINEARDERIRELAERHRKRGHQIVDPVSTPIDEAVSMMDGVVEEAERREALDRLLTLARQTHEAASQWAEAYGYTGVADEVDQIHEISHELTEAQWKVAAFAVEPEGARE